MMDEKLFSNLLKSENPKEFILEYQENNGLGKEYEWLLEMVSDLVPNISLGLVYRELYDCYRRDIIHGFSSLALEKKLVLLDLCFPYLQVTQVQPIVIVVLDSLGNDITPKQKYFNELCKFPDITIRLSLNLRKLLWKYDSNLCELELHTILKLYTDFEHKKSQNVKNINELEEKEETLWLYSSTIFDSNVNPNPNPNPYYEQLFDMIRISVEMSRIVFKKIECLKNKNDRNEHGLDMYYCDLYFSLLINLKKNSVSSYFDSVCYELNAKTSEVLVILERVIESKFVDYEQLNFISNLFPEKQFDGVILLCTSFMKDCLFNLIIKLFLESIENEIIPKDNETLSAAVFFLFTLYFSSKRKGKGKSDLQNHFLRSFLPILGKQLVYSFIWDHQHQNQNQHKNENENDRILKCIVSMDNSIFVYICKKIVFRLYLDSLSHGRINEDFLFDDLFLNISFSSKDKFIELCGYHDDLYNCKIDFSMKKKLWENLVLNIQTKTKHK